MSVEYILLGLLLLVGLYSAWNIGANDVANAMGTSVGSGALTLKRAVIIAAIFEFGGAVLVGSNVANTVRKKIFDPANLIAAYGDEKTASLVLGCGMIASLLAAGTWLMIATWKQWPVSTTHSIVGAVVGFGCVSLGIEMVNWSEVGFITAGWVVSPLLSGAVAYALFSLILKSVFHKRDPVRAARRIAPYLVFMVLIVLCGVLSYKGLKPLWKRVEIDPLSDPRAIFGTIGVAIVLGVFGALLTKSLIDRSVKGEAANAGESSANALHSDVSRSLGKALMHLERVRANTEGDLNGETASLIERVKSMKADVVEVARDSPDDIRKVEKIFVYLQILTACFVAFAHGSNDVANAIGPLAAGWEAIDSGSVGSQAAIPMWALALGGTGIVLGLATWGWRVIATVGERITDLTPSRGFCAEFAAAITILMASVLPFGLPVSTTHTLVGAVLGVGLARGLGALNLRTMRTIVVSWAITVPIGAIFSVFFYLILKACFVPVVLN
jgi:PiT family inorganic phosphate transporter